MVPRPFEKREGKLGGPLSQPPPSRLIIPVPTESLLSNEDSKIFAETLARAMVVETVPAVVTPAQKGDWILGVKVGLQENMVKPQYSIISPKGKVEAVRDGMPVSPAEWSKGDKGIFDQVAAQAAPIITEVLTGLQARRMELDPKSLKHRAAQIYFQGVKGAPGDGNEVIARQFVVSIVDQSNSIQLKEDKADYKVTCEVSVTNGAAGNTHNPVQHVEIVWKIIDRKGNEAGKVTQINDVPAHSLDSSWGDVGAAIGEEAAGGIKRVISNYSGRNNKPLPETKNGFTKSPLVAPLGLLSEHN
ncbi:hypothetical protein [Commensalibacter sp. Nvir]|uniref:hypothetical protein n=1 Tax=Commensalibacter sp. Nvir TaxID=3069817 RepID=UPI0030C7DC23